MTDKQYVYLCIIAERKLKDVLEDELYNAGGALIDIVYGRGYHESRTLLEFLGFGVKKGKVILSCLISREKSTEVLDKLNEQYSFNKPDTGIAFTVPVESIVY